MDLHLCCARHWRNAGGELVVPKTTVGGGASNADAPPETAQPVVVINSGNADLDKKLTKAVLDRIAKEGEQPSVGTSSSTSSKSPQQNSDSTTTESR